MDIEALTALYEIEALTSGDSRNRIHVTKAQSLVKEAMKHAYAQGMRDATQELRKTLESRGLI